MQDEVEEDEVGRDRALAAAADEAFHQMNDRVADNLGVVFSTKIRRADITKLNALYWPARSKFKKDNSFGEDKRISRPKVAGITIYSAIRSKLKLFDVDVPGGQASAEEMSVYARYVFFFALIQMILKIDLVDVLSEDEQRNLCTCFDRMYEDEADSESSLYLLIALLQRLWDDGHKRRQRGR